MRLAKLTLVAVALTATACGGGPTTRDPSGLFTHDRTVSDAGYSGVLKIHDGCVYLDTTGAEQALVFPEGFTKVDDAILGSDGRVAARFGDAVETGGDQDSQGAPCATPSGSTAVIYAKELTVESP